MSESGEKSFAPTQKRRRDAALKGDVLRSRELATAIGVLVGAGWLKFQGPLLMDGLKEVARLGLTWDRAILENFSPGDLVLPIMGAVLVPVLTLAAAVMVVTIASQLAFADGRFVGANLAPKGSRLDPLAGLKRMFGPTGWIEMGKGIAKVGLLGAIAYAWAKAEVARLAGFSQADVFGQFSLAWDAIVSLLFALAGGLVVIALIDVPIQMFRRSQRLMMSHQDMRDEHKEAEGSPEKRAAQRRRQREIAMGGVQNAMREAQFVVVNPEHFSVALCYDPAKAAAPIVLAKGRGEKALAMRELAAEMAVPVLSYPALARSIFFTTRERQVIREELYIAVASVLAFVFSLKRGEQPPRPAVHVPIELRFDATGRLDPRAGN
ncbi:MAG: flagellar biosynthesis protein [Sphingomonadales bacterium 32-68-7]|nr:MAG: flagellar biosynthesis protein [Sphingomonadales bacterium 12-68-11]OYX10167.1 MAG: flagellar biosynthesis protein [Sphingomonadales bacterium 32-68-7]